jgi:hypothetical protein
MWSQLGSTITSTNTGGKFGTSVSLSSDGTTLAVGSDNESSNAGAVRIYCRTVQVSTDVGTAVYALDVSGQTYMKSNVYSLQPDLNATLQGSISSAGAFGYSCALSSDGLTLAVGAYNETRGVDSAGCVRVYTRPSSTSTSWSAPAELSPQVYNAYFGYSCALSSDGLTLAVGANNETRGGQAGAGCVRVYTRPSSTSTSWSAPAELQATLQAGVTTGGEFGTSCALSSDGLTLVVGSPNETRSGQGGAGYVRVYTRPSSTSTSWSASAEVVGNVSTGGHFGNSCALSSDGLTLAVGAREETRLNAKSVAVDFAGCVRVFIRPSSTSTSWSAPAELQSGVYSFFGQSCALSSDGLTLAVGAMNETRGGQGQAGCVRVYTRPSSTTT